MTIDASMDLLHDALLRLEDYREGVFPRPDLDQAITDAADAFHAVNTAGQSGSLPAEWQRHWRPIHPSD